MLLDPLQLIQSFDHTDENQIARQFPIRLAVFVHILEYFKIGIESDNGRLAAFEPCIANANDRAPDHIVAIGVERSEETGIIFFGNVFGKLIANFTDTLYTFCFPKRVRLFSTRPNWHHL